MSLNFYFMEVSILENDTSNFISDNEVIENYIDSESTESIVVEDTENIVTLQDIHTDLSFIICFIIFFVLVVLMRYVYKFFDMFFVI